MNADSGSEARPDGATASGTGAGASATSGGGTTPGTGSVGRGHPEVHQRRVEIYLDSCSVRGVLETIHPRVSDHLASEGETLTLLAARVVTRDGTQLSRGAQTFVQKSVILFIVDLSAPGGYAGFRVERLQREVMLNVGSIWLRGRAHLPIGADLANFVAGSMARFMPITDATVIGASAIEPRTVLVNRDQLRCMIVE